MTWNPHVTSHNAVPVMTVDAAHTVMQLHIDCNDCPVKRQAMRRLIEAGRLVPDSHRGGY